MKKKAKAKGKAKASRTRSAVKDLGTRTASSVKGGLPAVQLRSATSTVKLGSGLLLPAVQKAADGSV